MEKFHCDLKCVVPVVSLRCQETAYKSVAEDKDITLFLVWIYLAWTSNSSVLLPLYLLDGELLLNLSFFMVT